MVGRGAAFMLPSSSSSSAPPPLEIDNKSCTTRLTRRRTALQLALQAVVVVPFSAQAASTPYSQSRTLQLGLDANGISKIRVCPSTNPGCVSTNPTVGASSSVASPLLIPESVTSADAAAELLRQAIMKTQRNVSFLSSSEFYIQAEVDGGGGGFFGRPAGRDVMEFLVKMDAGVVAYRCMAKEVTFVYPFTTAVGDSRGQEQRVAAIAQELGWYAPDIRSSIDPR